MMKGPTHQGDMTILYLHALNITTSTYIEQTQVEGETNSP